MYAPILLSILLWLNILPIYASPLSPIDLNRNGASLTSTTSQPEHHPPPSLILTARSPPLGGNQTLTPQTPTSIDIISNDVEMSMSSPICILNLSEHVGIFVLGMNAAHNSAYLLGAKWELRDFDTLWAAIQDHRVLMTSIRKVMLVIPAVLPAEVEGTFVQRLEDLLRLEFDVEPGIMSYPDPRRFGSGEGYNFRMDLNGRLRWAVE